MSKFTGFPKQAIVFLADLAGNNDRQWFAANKQEYETALKTPAHNCLGVLIDSLSQSTQTVFDGKIFRIHRDVRFAKDKTPYNPFVRMAFFPKDNQAGFASFYLSLEARKLVLGVGALAFSKQQLQHYRTAITDPRRAEALMEICACLCEKNYRIDEPELKRLPPGTPKDHQHEAMLRRKSLAFWLDLPHPDELTKADFIDFCMTHYNEMRPAYDWLADLE